MRLIAPEDLVRYGMIPEFIGRLPIVSVLDPLTEADLVRILLRTKNAMVKQYSKLFAMDGVHCASRATPWGRRPRPLSSRPGRAPCAPFWRT